MYIQNYDFFARTLYILFYDLVEIFFEYNICYYFVALFFKTIKL